VSPSSSLAPDAMEWTPPAPYAASLGENMKVCVVVHVNSDALTLEGEEASDFRRLGYCYVRFLE
jgi:hypothetical protein